MTTVHFSYFGDSPHCTWNTCQPIRANGLDGISMEEADCVGCRQFEYIRVSIDSHPFMKLNYILLHSKWAFRCYGDAHNNKMEHLFRYRYMSTSSQRRSEAATAIFLSWICQFSALHSWKFHYDVIYCVFCDCETVHHQVEILSETHQFRVR